MPERKHGYRPDTPDQRDHIHIPQDAYTMQLPPRVDLRAAMERALDQYSMNSCTACAVRVCLDYDRRKNRMHPIAPSRLFLYYNSRVLEGLIKMDDGASLRDTCKVVQQWGYCDESLWPYDKELLYKRPPPEVYQAAKQHAGVEYQRLLHDIQHLRAVLARGTPFVFGFTAFNQFDSDEVAKTGVVPMPKPGDKIMGDHAMMVGGYDDHARVFLALNDWGPSWGKEGWCTMPYDYLTSRELASDFWIITHVVP